MKKMLLAMLLVLSTQVLAKGTLDKVIYGTDDRLDLYESNDSLMKEISRSTAVMIYNNNLINQDKTDYVLRSETLAQYGVCKDERFANQPNPGNCSGFLVAPDKLVTAGHCITNQNQCAQHFWVFDFANTTEETKYFRFSPDQMARCRKIIERKKDNVTGADYAVVLLDRKMEGRTPLEFRKEGKVAGDTLLTVIGHPSGLPTKITAAVEIRDNSESAYFVTNADTFGGNSGSAVVDSTTGLVEGILVRGDTDYSTAPGERCQRPVYRESNGGRGEDITRITIIKDLTNN